MTIMSKECAERCGIYRLVDTRYAGIVNGVGTGRSLGRIHLAQIKLGNSFFQFSITVLETFNVDFILGLDMMRRHRCIVDLAEGAFKIEGHGGYESIRFSNPPERSGPTNT